MVNEESPPAAGAEFSALEIATDQGSIPHAGEVLRASPADAAYDSHYRSQPFPRQVNYQLEELPGIDGPGEQPEQDDTDDPCAAVAHRPFYEFDINTEIPTGQLPADVAESCFASLNERAGPVAAQRCWDTATFTWAATCLCHRPLYFEQTNLERYGYGCCEALQPAASAAHFFGTVPVLPYCMAAECPMECVYTLGHYRPGSCVPKRYIWPPCDPLAIAAQGGVWTGMIFLIP